MCLRGVTVNADALAKVIAVSFALHDRIRGEILPFLVVGEDEGASRPQGGRGCNAVVAYQGDQK